MDTCAILCHLVPPCGCWQRSCFAPWTVSQKHGSVATRSPEQLFASEMEIMACRMYREAIGSVAKKGFDECDFGGAYWGIMYISIA